jgi:hypothetical protein
MKSKISIATILILSLVCISNNICGAETFYCNSGGSGAKNGQGWDTAWNCEDVFAGSGTYWASSDTPNKIDAGDTLYIDGGSSPNGVTYAYRLVVGASGDAVDGVITISVGQDEGHNYMAIIDQDYADGTYSNIKLQNVGYVKITGQVGAEATPHFRTTKSYYHGINITGTSNNIEIAYMDITLNGAIGATAGICGDTLTLNTNIATIHHCTLHENYEQEIWVQAYTSGGYASTFEVFKIYQNTFYTMCENNITLSAGGASIYNNTFYGPHASGSCGADPHPDGIQFWGRYMKIYNNYFHDFIASDGQSGGNSYIRFNPGGTSADKTPTEVYIYNNLGVETHTPDAASQMTGITLSLSDDITSASKLYILNNTIIGTPAYAIGIAAGRNCNGSLDVSDIAVENNIVVDGARSTGANAVLFSGCNDNYITYSDHGGAGMVIADYNSVYDAGPGTTTIQLRGTNYTYANYIAQNMGGANNLHDVSSVPLDPGLNGSYGLSVTSNATDAGVSLSTMFTTDKNGITRGAAWDIGAYEYDSSTAKSVMSIGSGAAMSIGAGGATATLY